METRCSRLRFEFEFEFPESDRHWLCKPGGQRERAERGKDGEGLRLRTTETSHRLLVATAFACISPTPAALSRACGKKGAEPRDGEGKARGGEMAGEGGDL